jgi:RNA polymerase sigma factor (sigma-70 family)
MGNGSQTVEVAARFNAIIEQYGRFLRQAIARLCPQDMGLQFDDIVQEAHVRVWRALESEREITDLASYLYRIAATATIDAMRRTKARREDQLEAASEGMSERGLAFTSDSRQTPEVIAEQQQLIEKVELALMRLIPARRQSVRLHLEGMTSQEIADLMGWSEPKARNLTYRGLRDLRTRLRAEGIDYEID